MPKIETLTDYQKSQIIPHRDFWLNYILTCKNRTDREKAKAGIEWLYKFCKKKPPVIIFMDSPYGCQVAANFFINLLKSNPANIRDNIRANIWDNISANIGANIRDNIGDNISANIGANIRDNIGDNISANIWDNIRANIGANKLEYHSTGYYGNVSDYGWVAWIDYFFQMGLIVSDKRCEFEKFKELILSGVFEMIQFDGMCIVSDMPTKLVRNPDGRLHNPNGHAVEFKDGYCQYYINGRHLPSWIWEKAKAGEITREMFLNETNAEIKGGIYEVMGQKRMMDLLGAHEIDTQQIVHRNGDIETVTLLKTSETFAEINNQPFAWVKMICPSTGSQYLIGCEPHHTNALEAIASLSPLKAREYSFTHRS